MFSRERQLVYLPIPILQGALAGSQLVSPGRTQRDPCRKRQPNLGH